MTRKTRLQPEPQRGPSFPEIWNLNLSTVSQTNVRENPTFWTKRKIIGIGILILVVLAGIIIGVVADALERRHTTQPSSASSSANLSTFAGPTLLPTAIATPTPSRLSSPLPSSHPIPTTLATAFQSASWIWLGAQALTGVPAGNWAFRKALPTSTAPAREAVLLLTVDNAFILYHNGQLIVTNMDEPIWWNVAAVYAKLDPNSNVFAVLAQNFHSDTDPNGPSFAGLRASIQISYVDGTTITISSDDTWRVTQPIPDGFESLSFNDTQWQFATALGDGFERWGNVTIPQDYNVTVR